MITKEQTNHFTAEWIEVWNAHNLEQILEHYTDDFEFTSPFIIELMKVPSGTLKGKETIRPYWARLFERVPDLRFEAVDNFMSANSIIIRYDIAALNKKAAEIMFFDSAGKVFKSVAHYNQETKF